MLTRDNLQGIFAAVPIAMDAEGQFVEEDFAADIRTLCEAGVHGIYTTGTTGEWYALDDEEFRWLVRVFLEQTSGFDTLTQIGCGGLSTQAVIDRVRIAIGEGDHRPAGLQIILPSWCTLADDEID